MCLWTRKNTTYSQHIHIHIFIFTYSYTHTHICTNKQTHMSFSHCTVSSPGVLAYDQINCNHLGIQNLATFSKKYLIFHKSLFQVNIGKTSCYHMLFFPIFRKVSLFGGGKERGKIGKGKNWCSKFQTNWKFLKTQMTTFGCCCVLLYSIDS